MWKRKYSSSSDDEERAIIRDKRTLKRKTKKTKKTHIEDETSFKGKVNQKINELLKVPLKFCVSGKLENVPTTSISVHKVMF